MKHLIPQIIGILITNHCQHFLIMMFSECLITTYVTLYICINSEMRHLQFILNKTLRNIVKLNCSRTNFIQQPAPQFKTALMTMHTLYKSLIAYRVIIFICFLIIFSYANQSFASAYWAFCPFALQPDWDLFHCYMQHSLPISSNAQLAC